MLKDSLGSVRFNFENMLGYLSADNLRPEHFSERKSQGKPPASKTVSCITRIFPCFSTGILSHLMCLGHSCASENL